MCTQAEMYRPCAPDGFIPNSVVREWYTGINSQHPAVKEEEKDDWKPPPWLDEWGEMKSNAKDDGKSFKGLQTIQKSQ